MFSLSSVHLDWSSLDRFQTYKVKKLLNCHLVKLNYIAHKPVPSLVQSYTPRTIVNLKSQLFSDDSFLLSKRFNYTGSLKKEEEIIHFEESPISSKIIRGRKHFSQISPASETRALKNRSPNYKTVHSILSENMLS